MVRGVVLPPLWSVEADELHGSNITVQGSKDELHGSNITVQGSKDDLTSRNKALKGKIAV